MTDKNIKHIVGPLESISIGQFGVELVVDPVTGHVMWGGKDVNGDVTRWLALDKNARVNDLETLGAFLTQSTQYKENITPVPATRTIDWNENENAPQYYSEVSASTSIIGKNVNIPLAYNDTGSAIPAGTPCRVVGAFTSRPGVEPVSSLTHEAEDTLVYPKDVIPIASYGECLWFGAGEGIDTNLFAPDDKLYLSETVGVFTTTPPANKVYVGRCLVASSSVGRILFIGVSGGGASNLLHPEPEYIDLMTGLAAPAYKKGRISWDEANQCPAFYDDFSGTWVQMTQELTTRSCNDTGDTIANGSVVYGAGSDGGCLNVGLLQADTYDRNQVLSVATLDIPTKNLPTETGVGKFTKFGTVRDFPTDHLIEGKKIFASSSPGLLTSVRPDFPAMPIVIGYCLKSHATEGIIFVDISIDPYDYEFDGSIVERHDYTIEVEGANVFLDMEKVGGGDVPVQLIGSTHLVDCATGAGVDGKARVQLTTGTDTAPVDNYPYISLVGDVATLQNATSVPEGVLARVGAVSLWSATKTDTDKPLKNRRNTSAVSHGGIGRMEHINARLGALGSAWVRGGGMSHDVVITTVGGALDSIDITVQAGKAWQILKQDFPLMQLSVDGAYVISSTGGALARYDKITDANQSLQTVDGTAIGANRRFNFILYAFINKTVSECKFGWGLPTDTYATDDSAYKDVSFFSPLQVNDSEWEVAFPVLRLPLVYTAVNGGTLAFINPPGEPEWVNLLGTPLNASALGAAGTAGITLYTQCDDVNVVTPLDGQISAYDSGSAKFINSPVTVGQITANASAIDELTQQEAYENTIAAAEDGITLTTLGEKNTVRIDHAIFGSPTPAAEVGLSGFNAIKVSTKPAGGTPISLSVCNKYMGWVDNAGKFFLRDSLDMGAILEITGLSRNHMAVSDYFSAHITATNIEYRSLPELELEQVARANGSVSSCHIADSGRVYFVDGSDFLVIMSPARAVEYSAALTGVAGSVVNVSINKAETRLYIVDDIGTGIYIRQYNVATKALLGSTPVMEGDETTTLSQYPDEADSSLIYFNRTDDLGVDYLEAVTSDDVSLGAIYSENMDDLVGPSYFHNGILYSVDASMRKYMTPGPYQKLAHNLRLTSATSVALSNTEDSSEIYTLYDLTNEVKRRRSDRFGDEIKVVRKASQLLPSGDAIDTLTINVLDMFKADYPESLVVDFVARATIRGTNSGYHLRKAHVVARDGVLLGSETATIDTIVGYDTISVVNPRIYTNWNLEDPEGTPITKLQILATVNSSSTFSTDIIIDWVFEIIGHAIKGVGTYC